MKCINDLKSIVWILTNAHSWVIHMPIKMWESPFSLPDIITHWPSIILVEVGMFYIIIHIQSCCRYCFMYSCFYIPPIPKTYSHCAMHSLHTVMLFKEYSVIEFMTIVHLVSVWLFSMIFFLILGLNLVQSLFCLKLLFTELWENND